MLQTQIVIVVKVNFNDGLLLAIPCLLYVSIYISIHTFQHNHLTQIYNHGNELFWFSQSVLFFIYKKLQLLLLRKFS